MLSSSEFWLYHLLNVASIWAGRECFRRGSLIDLIHGGLLSNLVACRPE